MRRLLWLILLAVVFVPSVRGAGAEAPSEAVTDALAQMNKELGALIALPDAKLTGKGSDTRIQKLITAKHQMIGHFPRIFGERFIRFYRTLETIDAELVKAKEAVVLQKKEKALQHLEAAAGKAGTGDLIDALGDAEGLPKGAIKKAVGLERGVNALIKDIEKQGLGDERWRGFVHGINELVEDKFGQLHGWPDVYGVSFHDVFQDLELMDTFLGRAKDAKEADTIRKYLRISRDEKERIEKAFEKANKPRCPKRVSACLYRFAFAGTGGVPALNVSWLVNQTNIGTTEGSFAVVSGTACGSDPLAATWTIIQRASTSGNRLNTLTVSFLRNPYPLYIGSYTNAGNIEISLRLTKGRPNTVSLEYKATSSFSNVVVSPTNLAVTATLVKSCA